MTTKISTGLRNHLAVTGSLRAAFNTNSRLSIYGGSEVASADSDATGASLLVVITGPAAAGLEFEAAATSGNLLKLAAQVWEGNPAASGTATWYRLETLSDTRGSSTTALRVQGDIGQVVGDMVFTNPAVTVGTPKRIDNGAISVVSA